MARYSGSHAHRLWRLGSSAVDSEERNHFTIRSWTGDWLVGSGSMGRRVTSSAVVNIMFTHFCVSSRESLGYAYSICASAIPTQVVIHITSRMMSWKLSCVLIMKSNYTRSITPFSSTYMPDRLQNPFPLPTYPRSRPMTPHSRQRKLHPREPSRSPQVVLHVTFSPPSEGRTLVRLCITEDACNTDWARSASCRIELGTVLLTIFETPRVPVYHERAVFVELTVHFDG
jgi:hypothetical protein